MYSPSCRVPFLFYPLLSDTEVTRQEQARKAAAEKAAQQQQQQQQQLMQQQQQQQQMQAAAAAQQPQAMVAAAPQVGSWYAAAGALPAAGHPLQPMLVQLQTQVSLLGQQYGQAQQTVTTLQGALAAVYLPSSGGVTCHCPRLTFLC